jgi:hypothetical protein
MKMRSMICLLLASSLLRARSMICLLLVSSLILHPSSFLRADGGTIRLSERQGNYRITVFSAPTLVRAGPVDISVLVQDAATGQPVSGVQVAIQAARRGSPGLAVQHHATTEAATNKLLYAAAFDLPEPGWYALEVSVDGVLGQAQVRFDLEAAEPLPPWLAMAPWVGWPILAILLFGVHQLLVRRKTHSAAIAMTVVPPGLVTRLPHQRRL